MRFKSRRRRFLERVTDAEMSEIRQLLPLANVRDRTTTERLVWIYNHHLPDDPKPNSCDSCRANVIQFYEEIS